MRSSSPDAVEVDGLVKRYGPTVAVDGVSFTIPRGSVLALLGPNGAGKTTTVETCEGFRVPDAGAVRVLGLDPRNDRAALAPRVGVMLQEGGVYPGAYPLEMLRLVASFHADALDPRPLLERLEIAERTTYRRLSGGLKQRLSLAMAVVGRPEVVFLDEPTAGLDPAARMATWALVRDLRDEGVTVLLTTHAMDEAEALADRVVIVSHGRVVASGTVADLTRGEDALRFSTTAGLAIPDAVEEAPGTYVVRDPTPARVAAVTAWCASHDVAMTGLRTDRRTLQDVYLEVTS